MRATLLFALLLLGIGTSLNAQEKHIIEAGYNDENVFEPQDITVFLGDSVMYKWVGGHFRYVFNVDVPGGWYGWSVDSRSTDLDITDYLNELGVGVYNYWDDDLGGNGTGMHGSITVVDSAVGIGYNKTEVFRCYLGQGGYLYNTISKKMNMYDLSGRLLAKASSQIDVSTLNRGLYIVEVISKEGNVLGKVKWMKLN